jgi:tRNA A-37 threonylcarbamoyl transferase component Bud32
MRIHIALFSIYLSGCSHDSNVDCESSISSVHVAGKGWKNVKRTPHAPNGENGVVYPTDDPNLVIKISKRFDMCKEIAALQALDGLGGFAPRMYPLDKTDPGIDSDCVQKVIVMDAVGDKTFTEIPAPSVKDTYTRLGKLVEAIKTLHATGISHGDLHGNNIRVNSADPSKVFLVDFGLVEEGINEKDLSELCFRAAVPHQQTDTIVKNFCIATGVGVIDSDFWIALFRRLGADPNGLDDATRSAVEKIKQESVATLLGRVNQLLKELIPENGPQTLNAIYKLQKTPTARPVETEINGALAQVRKLIETWRRLSDLTI